MQAYLLEFGNLLLRWLHVVAAIAWIGESIYFVMLDNSLRPPTSAEGKKRGVFGEMWAVHGGGFYHNQKYLTNPAELPNDLHWSFWKAYTTWLTGFAIFATMYLVKPDFYLVNAASQWAWAASLAGWQASVLAVVFLLAGWVIYDQLCRRISPNMEHDGILSVAVAVMMVAVAYLSCQIFPGRAAFLITGAVMATCMSANVFFWIIPGQRRMVKALKAGEKPDPLDGKRGKQRSVHNTYFTLPVVLLMLSNHYSFIYSGAYAWVILSLFIVSGAAIRQYFVLRHSGQNKLVYPVVGVALLGVIAYLAAPQPAASTGAAGSTAETVVTTQQVMQIMQARCVQCHAAKPSHFAFPAAPAGMALETEQELLAHPDLIKQVVANGYMPLGNLTDMTPDERAAVAAWSLPPAASQPTHR
ncbi:MAG TPA: urate hydroxylase PuuD [Pusillimonas sp.]|uniref:urate hydroxylase PuuD n=1 Tax=Pusillimonas sp. TaxID=3040095 RepID=UPI002BD585BA|nr:urate hydroxylase PuuD [Pusillimonas sp.]HUH87403.1 urate hydroxylase PuuD [Pusillimonas sp.]